jgi:hypothetical protein
VAVISVAIFAIPWTLVLNELFGVEVRYRRWLKNVNGNNSKRFTRLESMFGMFFD